MTDSVSVKLLFFAKAKELVGKSEAEAKFLRNNFTKKTLLEDIFNIYEVLQPLANCLLLAINEEYVDSSETFYLNEGDTIAVMPPLSGG